MGIFSPDTACQTHETATINWDHRRSTGCAGFWHPAGDADQLAQWHHLGAVAAVEGQLTGVAVAADQQPPALRVQTICFVSLIFLGFAGTASTANQASAPTANSVPTDAAAPASKTDPQSSAAAASVKPASPATSFGDGTWVVGEDIQHVTYRSPGAKPGFFDVCSPAPTPATLPTARSLTGRRLTLGSQYGSRCRVRRSR